MCPLRAAIDGQLTVDGVLSMILFCEIMLGMFVSNSRYRQPYTEGLSNLFTLTMGKSLHHRHVLLRVQDKVRRDWPTMIWRMVQLRRV